MAERKYESIKDLPLPDLFGYHGRYESVDPHIEDLVRVINVLGYHTTASCEGHLDEFSHPYPWRGATTTATKCTLTCGIFI